MLRALLYVPADQERLLQKSVASPADAVVLDLEDGVPPDGKSSARRSSAEHLRRHRVWVRLNEPRSEEAVADCAELVETSNLLGVRIPKVEDPDDVAWVAARLPGVQLICGIESARGLLAATEIAQGDQVRALSLGGVDFLRELGVEDNAGVLSHLRVHLVLASAAAGIDKPVDRVYPRVRDMDGLRRDAMEAKEIGFGGKSALSPRQVEVIQSVFTVSPAQLSWATDVLAAFEESGGRPTTAPDGSFVDLPVAERARDIVRQATVA